jgi:hypothetical protein
MPGAAPDNDSIHLRPFRFGLQLQARTGKAPAEQAHTAEALGFDASSSRIT